MTNNKKDYFPSSFDKRLSTKNGNIPLWDKAVVQDILNEKDRDTKFKKLNQYAEDCIGKELLEELYTHYSPAYARLKDGQLRLSLARFSNTVGTLITPPYGVELSNFMGDLLDFMKTKNALIKRMYYTPSAPCTRDGYVVLIALKPNEEEEEELNDPYVTGWLGVDEQSRKLDKSWTSGHYYSDYLDALTDFKIRVMRGY